MSLLQLTGALLGIVHWFRALLTFQPLPNRLFSESNGEQCQMCVSFHNVETNSRPQNVESYVCLGLWPSLQTITRSVAPAPAVKAFICIWDRGLNSHIRLTAFPHPHLLGFWAALQTTLQSLFCQLTSGYWLEDLLGFVISNQLMHRCCWLRLVLQPEVYCSSDCIIGAWRPRTVSLWTHPALCSPTS